MSKRNQKRVKAVLPLKVTVCADGQRYLAHSIDISASGARMIVPVGFDAGTEMFLEHKHRRCKAVAVWSKQIAKNECQVGLRLLNREQAFWMVDLAMQEEDDFSVKTELHFDRLWAGLKHPPVK